MARIFRRVPNLDFARFTIAVLGAVGLLAAVSAPDTASAQFIPQEVEDASDQLDVPFIASHQNVVETMLGLAKVAKDDYVIDLGSGDGRIVLTAARKYGARGFGVDLNEDLVAIANNSAREQGVADRAHFYVRDLFKTDISQATVLTMYLLPDIVLKLRPRLLADLSPGTRILSHDYDMGAWRPDISRRVNNAWGSRSVVHFWVVPADVAGVWVWNHAPRRGQGPGVSLEATFQQRFQQVTGAVRRTGAAATLSDVRLRGTQIRFRVASGTGPAAIRRDYVGTVSGDRISGTVKRLMPEGEVVQPWQARRGIRETRGRPR